jgi:hypothetical protein|tara:strand:+ start:146 stop:541 length:396 start_codon:yes stop_codon:yes gene_type:complete
MQKFIDNIPTKNDNRVESDLGKRAVTSKVSPATKEANVTHTPFQNDYEKDDETSSVIKIDNLTKLFNVFTNITGDEKQEMDETKKKETTESDDDSVDINDIFKNDWLNNAFMGTISVLGLFIFYRIIQKSK